MKDVIKFLDKHKIPKEKYKIVEDRIVFQKNYTLDLSNRVIYKLPKNFGCIVCRVIDLEGNNLKKLPKSIVNLKTSFLHLNDNILKKLPEDIDKLTLLVLDIFNNNIKKYPENFKNIKVSNLGLDDNTSIDILVDFYNFKGLEETFFRNKGTLYHIKNLLEFDDEWIFEDYYGDFYNVRKNEYDIDEITDDIAIGFYKKQMNNMDKEIIEGVMNLEKSKIRENLINLDDIPKNFKESEEKFKKTISKSVAKVFWSSILGKEGGLPDTEKLDKTLEKMTDSINDKLKKDLGMGEINEKLKNFNDHLMDIKIEQEKERGKKIQQDFINNNIKDNELDKTEKEISDSMIDKVKKDFGVEEIFGRFVKESQEDLGMEEENKTDFYDIKQDSLEEPIPSNEIPSDIEINNEDVPDEILDGYYEMVRKNKEKNEKFIKEMVEESKKNMDINHEEELAKKLEDEKKQTAMEKQIGGKHYDVKIQPVEYILANNIGFCEGNVIKYVSRYKDKNGLQDLEKAKHYIEILIEEYKKENEQNS